MSRNAGCRVGHDAPCEWLHADITASVQTRVTEASISDYIKARPFCATVDQQVREVLGFGAESSERKLKNMDVDVATLKKMFREHIGATWAQAARTNTTSVLMTAAAMRRSKKPWEELGKVGALQGNDSTAAYVRRHLQTYAFRHEWMP